jgi:hypothetical protein
MRFEWTILATAGCIAPAGPTDPAFSYAPPPAPVVDTSAAIDTGYAISTGPQGLLSIDVEDGVEFLDIWGCDPTNCRYLHSVIGGGEFPVSIDLRYFDAVRASSSAGSDCASVWLTITEGETTSWTVGALPGLWDVDQGCVGG